MIVFDEKGNCRIYPKMLSSYKWDCEEEKELQNKILRIIKRKRLPKMLEVSLLKNILKAVEDMPEHDYSEKYDTFPRQHSKFY